MRAEISVSQVPFVSDPDICEDGWMGRLTGQTLESLVQILDVGDGHVADVGHEVGDVASAVGHLLVDVVVAEDRVDWVYMLERSVTVADVEHAYLSSGHRGHYDGCR